MDVMNEAMRIAGLDKFEFDDIQGDDEGLLAEVMQSQYPKFGCTIAVDTYCLLHRGAVGMIDRNGNQRDNGQYVRYVFKYVEMLLDNGVKPLLVFDGFALPAKAQTRKKRREQRENNKKKAEEYRRSGEFDKARSALMQAVEITSDMAYAVICECRARGVDYIVAPYEADAELAYLNRAGIADAVWTVDADLLLFGCDKVIYNMDECGRGLLYEVTLDNLRLVCGVEKSRVEFSFEHFRRMCILSGCDYLESPRGVGIRTARSAIQKALATGQTDVRGLIARVAQQGGARCHIEPNYADAFVEAELTFLHQLVYDPLQRRLVPLTPYSSTSTVPLSPSKRTDNNETENRSLDFAGHNMPQELAHWLAVGNVNVNTRQPIPDAKFDPTTNRSFLERVCTTLRERSEKFLRNERTRARRAESQSSTTSSRTGAAVLFSFECEKAPAPAPAESKGLTKSGLSIWDPRFPSVLRGSGEVGELQNLPASIVPPPRTLASQTQTPSFSQRHSPQKRKAQSDVTNADCDDSDFVLRSYLNAKRCKLEDKPTAHSQPFGAPDSKPNRRDSYIDTKTTPTCSASANTKPNCNSDEVRRLDFDSAKSPILMRRTCLSRSNSNRFAVTTNDTDAQNCNAQPVVTCNRPVETLASPPEIGTASRYFDSSPTPPTQPPAFAPPPLPPLSTPSEKPEADTEAPLPAMQSPTTVPVHRSDLQQSNAAHDTKLSTTAVIPTKLENVTPCSSALSRFRLVATARMQNDTDVEAAGLYTSRDCTSPTTNGVVSGDLNAQSVEQGPTATQVLSEQLTTPFVTPVLLAKRATQPAPANDAAVIEADSSSESDADSDVQFVSTSCTSKNATQSAEESASTFIKAAQSSHDASRVSKSKLKSKPKQNSTASARSGCRVSGLSRYRQSTSASASQSRSSAPQQATLHRWFTATPTSH